MIVTEIVPQEYTILIVDDMIENVDILSLLLNGIGYQTTFAKDGKEAIENVKKTHIDLILLDLTMPIMDGLECCQILKTDVNYQDIPILFLTASQEEKDLAKAFEVGADDYVTKPFKKMELFTRIKHQLTISQQRKKLKQQTKEIEEKNLALELETQKLQNFNSMVCHDINNPLTQIIGFVDILKMRIYDKLDQKEGEFFQYIYDGAFHIHEIVANLRVLSEIKRIQYIESEEVNLSNLVQQILSEYKQKTPERQAEFIIEPDLIITGNKQLLQAGLDNLLNNAWKYSSKKEKTIIEFGTITKQKLRENQVQTPLHILEDLDENETIYFIQDNGAGFPQKEADKIFQIFQRLHTETEFKGTGIGLAIVKDIIDIYGGKIWCYGKVNESATFYFSF